MSTRLQALPGKLTKKHIGRPVKIRDDVRGGVIRRCWNADHQAYIGAGGYRLPEPDKIFYQPGEIAHVSDDGRRALVVWPGPDQPGLWLDVEHIENA